MFIRLVLPDPDFPETNNLSLFLIIKFKLLKIIFSILICFFNF